MFQKIEVLDKKKFKGFKFDDVDAREVAKNMGLIPVGFGEVVDCSYNSVIIINTKESGEFLAFSGLTKDNSIFNKDNVYLPINTRTYPFLNIFIKDQKENISSAIGIDNDDNVVSKSKTNSIFKEDGELTDLANKKIELVRILNAQREVSKKIVAELNTHNLLIKKDFRIKVGKEEKIILKEFYIVDREKMNSLDDKIIATWARKGWTTLIDCHLKSLANFEKIIKSTK